MNEFLGMGELAKKTGVKVVTVRYYEQIGILAIALNAPTKTIAPTTRGTRSVCVSFGAAAIWACRSSRSESTAINTTSRQNERRMVSGCGRMQADGRPIGDHIKSLPGSGSFRWFAMAGQSI
jgi:hypothetical protein